MEIKELLKPKRDRIKSCLLFIDTNILLDFYRSNNDAGLFTLRRIDKLHDRIITTSQVEMEFKKNRQKIIHDSWKSFKPIETKPSPPAFLQQVKAATKLDAHLKQAEKSVGKIKARIERVLCKPLTHDPVYQTAQRLFASEKEYHLTRKTKERYKIRRLAWKRYVLGYPPRKNSEVHLGDSINWEWIVHCVQQSNLDVILVSRDSDYGLSMNKDQSFVNDWLSQELKNRANIQRKIHLVASLTKALKLLGIPVTPAEEKAEIDREKRAQEYNEQVWKLVQQYMVSNYAGKVFGQNIEDLEPPDPADGF